MWKEFKDYLLKNNAISLALAVVLGAALNGVVQAIVNDLIMPIVSLVTPTGGWEEWKITIGKSVFLIGKLFGALLNFVIIGFVVWRISKMVTPAAPAAPARTCPFCKSSIDMAATRCPNCTSQLA